MLRNLVTTAVGLSLLAVILLPMLGGPDDRDIVAPERKRATPYEVMDYEGTLTEIAPNSIVLEGPNQAPRRFALGPALVAGSYVTDPNAQFDKYNSSGEPQYSYRVSDTQLGDKLKIYYIQVNGVDVCDQICIHRRPGGRVPPMPGRRRSYSRYEYHNLASWRGECEAKGLPWPYPPPPELPPEERDPNEKKSPQ
jgi:hypothetical protein